jgi:hypothetical protein
MELIPKVLITYWGGAKLSFLRYLTIYSFHKYNPEYTIIVYTPKYPTKDISWNTFEQSGVYDGEDWFPKLKDINNVHIVEMDMETVGLNNSLSEVHKSGLVRLGHLSQYGGVYCDMDILFFKKLPEFTKAICSKAPEGYFSDGFLACEPGNKVYTKLYQLCRSANTDDYQGFGPSLWNANVSEEDMKLLDNIPMSLVYLLDSNHIPDIHISKYQPYPEESIACHFYAGHPLARTSENIITDTEHNYDTHICEIVREIIYGQ